MLIRSNGQGWEHAEPASFVNEVEFQNLVEETFDQILATQSDAPAVIAREVAMPDQGKLDLLGIDSDGVITVCECKLATNAGARREVMGQVLEYASQLAGMSFREFRRRVENRLIGKDLLGAMERAAPEEWDRDWWTDEVIDRLDSGNFRVVIAVDAITPTLKQTVLYLNAHTDLPVFAVALQRAKKGAVEVLVPTLFAEEQARRKAPVPPSSTIEDADTVVVAATHALGEYDRSHAYICQPNRSFRDGIRYLGFYAKRRVEPLFPRVLGFKKNVPFTAEQATELAASADPLDQRVAKVIQIELASPHSLRAPGEAWQVVPLDPHAGFELDHEIKHEGAAAWLRGQRYTASSALKTQPSTTDELRAAGG